MIAEPANTELPQNSHTRTGEKIPAKEPQLEAQKETQLVVIGAGPGGYAAAFLAADLEMEVTLIDPAPNPGGVCLYRGCMPSKTLLHAAHLLEEAKKAERWGIRFSKPEIDVDRLRAWKEEVVAQLTGGLGQLSGRRKINYVQGKAVFSDSRSLNLTETGGDAYRLRFQNAILATGSRPVTVPSLSLQSPRLMNSTEALRLEDIPETLLVVGGGYIGLELGSVYAALGSEVSVVEMLPGLVPGADRDLVRILAKQIKEKFAAVMTGTQVIESSETGQGIRVVMADGSDARTEHLFDKVLVSVGRRPNSDDLGLENTGVTIDPQGFVRTDAAKRTDDPAIFAVGDVTGQPMLAHKASHEGRVAVEVIAGKDVIFDPAAIPAVMFTDPEIAWCGLTETEAKAQKRSVETVRFPWAASGRAQTQDCAEGLTKLLVDPETERILGVGMVGTGAGELIAEGVLAMEMATTVSDLKLSIHPHPTLSETLMEAAEVFFGQSTHTYRPKRKKK